MGDTRPIRADRVAEHPRAANRGIRSSAQACHVHRFLWIADKVADMTISTRMTRGGYQNWPASMANRTCGVKGIRT